jgi:transposase-like protein
MEKRQRFSAEFKREAIRMMQTSGKPAAMVARELGIPRNRLYKTGVQNRGQSALSSHDDDFFGLPILAGPARRPS